MAEDGLEKPQLHDVLEELLGQATARSLHVVATFLDIRGFSAFADRGGSFDTAYYLQSVFASILADRFSDRDYFKTTGDGLMLIHHLPKDTGKWPGVVRGIVERCSVLVDDFGTLTEGDYRVVPPVPQHLGVGIARGQATMLITEDKLVFDYTGPCLNLAARLMDKARPRGVIFADPYPQDMLGDVLADFIEDRIYIRGIAEEHPMKVFCSPDVVIHQRDRERPSGSLITWGAFTSVSIADTRKYESHAIRIPRRPASNEVALVRVGYDEYVDGKVNRRFFFDQSGKLDEDQWGIIIQIPLRHVHEVTSNTPLKSDRLLGLVQTDNKVTFQGFIRPKDPS